MNRTITTEAGLDALPIGSVVMCDDEQGVAKRVDRDASDGYDWLVVGSDEYRETHEMAWMLPATVLHFPGRTEADVAAEWADYFEQHDQNVGAEPLTPMRMVRILRGPKPFGIERGEGRG